MAGRFMGIRVSKFRPLRQAPGVTVSASKKTGLRLRVEISPPGIGPISHRKKRDKWENIVRNVKQDRRRRRTKRLCATSSKTAPKSSLRNRRIAAAPTSLHPALDFICRERDSVIAIAANATYKRRQIPARVASQNQFNASQNAISGS
jgi:hypothetical protein